MANKKLTAPLIKTILSCLFDKRLSLRSTANVVNVDRTAIKRATDRLAAVGISWPIPEDVTDERIQSIIYPTENAQARYHLIDFGKVHNSLQVKGATLIGLHQEWMEEDLEQNTIGYQTFCKRYEDFRRQLNISMRRVDPYGEFCYVDYSGLQPSFIDPEKKIRVKCQLFIGVLGGSKYTFVEATLTQKLEDWIGSHVRMFSFFGGAPRFTVPDNLKSGVTLPDRFFPLANETYKRMCDQYGTMVFPARARKPKDKPAAEGGVLLAQRWILFRIRNRTFFSLTELNQEIDSLRKQLNEKQFQKLRGSRFSNWLEHERQTLQPLPAKPYVFTEWGKTRAGSDYLVRIDESFYSVPNQYRNQEVVFKLTANTVEISHNNNTVAAHERSQTPGKVVIDSTHQPPNHRAISSWSRDETIEWATAVGPGTVKLIEVHIGKSTNNLVAYRTTAGLKKLYQLYGKDRLEEVCSYAVTNNIFTMATIREILSKKLDKLLGVAPAEEEASPTTHANVRGSGYYTKQLNQSQEPDGDD